LSPQFPQPFHVVLPAPTLNDTGRGLFSAIQGPYTVLATRLGGSGPYNISPVLTGFPNLYPMLADNDTTVVRWGGSITSPLLRIIDATLTAANFIAEAVDFNAIGEQPGISDDGNVVAFVGDHKTKGFGLFVSLFNGNDFTPIKVLSVGGLLSNFSLQPRVGVNRAVSDSVNQYTLCFIGFGPTGIMGLYTITVDITNPLALVVSDLARVVVLGDSINGLGGTVNNIKIYDPINNNQEVVFWVSTTSGDEAVVRARPVTRVQWSSDEPIQGAIIEAYYMKGTSKENAVLTPIPPAVSGQPTTTDIRGRFQMPKELTSYPLQTGEIEGRRGIRAKIKYTDYTMGQNPNTPTGAEYEVINYPDWDPLRPFQKPTVDPLVITFPNPVFFVPGMDGRVNGIPQLDPGGYFDSDGRIRAFMLLDNGSTPTEIQDLATKYTSPLSTDKGWDWQTALTQWVGLKKNDDPDLRIPAFVLWTIPTFHPDPQNPQETDKGKCSLLNGFLGIGNSHDAIKWGINACMAQTDERIKESAQKITAHFNQNILPQMQIFTPQKTEEISFNVLAHSLGGVISRHWLSTRKAEGNTYPTVEHYVTFDSPHGGVKLSNSAILRLLFHFNTWWSEAVMNGTNSLNNKSAREGGHTGWNYKNILDPTPKNLLLSAEDETLLGPFPFIAPDGITGTALGKGRIMKPKGFFTLLDLFGSVPNGYCEQFIGGWGLQVFADMAEPAIDKGTHSIQNVPRSFIAAARFLAKGKQPYMGTFSDPGGLLSKQDATFLPGSGPCAAQPSTLSPALVSHTLEAPAGTILEGPLFFDKAQTLTISALLTGPEGNVRILNAQGVELPRLNYQESPFESNGKLITFLVDVSAGQGILRLEAGSEDLGAQITVAYEGDLYATTSALNLHNALGSAVTVQAAIVDNSNGTVIIGQSGSGQVTLTRVDATSLVLDVFDDGQHGDNAAGDGIFGVVVPASELTAAARYPLKIEMKINYVSGEILHRMGDGMFYVDSEAGDSEDTVTERLIDSDGNGLAEALGLDITVNVKENSSLSLTADVLVAGKKVSFLREAFEVNNAPVTKTVTLKVPAKLLQTLGPDVQLTLSDISLYENVHALFLDSVPDHTTQPVDLSLVETPEAPALFACLPSYGPHNGGYEALFSGRNLDLVTEVYFGTQKAPSFEIINDHKLSVTVPPWDGANDKVAIKVVTPWHQVSRSFLFEYFTPNRPPVLAPIGHQTVNEGQLLQFSVQATDPNGDAITLSARLADGSPLGTIGASFTDNGSGSGSFSWTPTTDQGGADYQIVFEARDTQSLSDSEMITIHVLDVGGNQAPVLNPIGDKSVDEGQALTFTVSATDPDGDVLTYSASPLPPGASLNGTTGVFTWTPGFTQAGSYPVTFTVSDGSLTDSEMITIEVTNVNRAPVANAGLDQTVQVGTVVSFDGSASSDPDGDALTYNWDFGDGGTAAGQKVTHTYTGVNTYTVTLTVSDGSLSSADSLEVIVTPKSFSDNFNRPNSTSLGKDWSEVKGDLRIASQELRNLAFPMVHLAVVPALSGLTQEAEADFLSTLHLGKPQFGVVVRYQDSLNYYVMYRQTGPRAADNQLRIARVRNGTEQILKSKTVSKPGLNRFFRLGASVSGSTLKLKLDGVDQLTVEDGAYPRGAAGIFVNRGSLPLDHRADNFSAQVR